MTNKSHFSKKGNEMFQTSYEKDFLTCTAAMPTKQFRIFLNTDSSILVNTYLISTPNGVSILSHLSIAAANKGNFINPMPMPFH